MHIGYKRVSTQDQTTARQLVGIELDRVYEEHASGATKDRPELKRCLDALRKGDTLHVHAVDRLSRSMRDLLEIVEQVLKAEASIIIYSPRLEFSTNENNHFQTFQLQLFASIAQLERAMSRERQREGITQAKKKGTRSGKPFGKQPLDPNLKPQAIVLCDQGLNITHIAKELKISRASVYKLLEGHTRQITY
ncbi:recombinase family protein [Legionella maceachernii]|uniref:Transposon Tn21 resolvase n=1 Tax=Legionella maceachernii TaxID=466 RepID=A0A0W0WBG2_9GAMM|nr:recombinase family protein [Legionella maceachernii]KTD29691.1 Transposon Tn21 resolvase [Legionella maceachernii]SKA21173.1 Site-specific DNA recombinase [Legionella maceachernii]SUP02564.1 Putative transposon Tn552 DNA-invertase bin3 [Legionella maceachernii]